MSKRTLYLRILVLSVMVLMIMPVFAVDLINDRNPKLDAAIGQHKDSKLDETDVKKTMANDGGDEGMSFPTDTAIHTISRRVFVADEDNGRVLAFDLNGSDVQLDQAADVVLGKKDFQEPAFDTPTADNLVRPTALALDALGSRLFVADSGARRILVFGLAGLQDGEEADNVLGQANFVTGGDQGVTDASFSDEIRGMHYDFPSNRLYVADTGNNRVLVFDVSTVIDNESAISVIGQADFTSAASIDPPTANSLTSPTDCTLNLGGTRLVVSDGGNNRTLFYNISDGITNGEAAVVVLGQDDFISNASGTASNRMDQPASVAMDLNANLLLVCDTNNHRVLLFGAAAPGNGDNAVNVLGQDDFISGTPGTNIDSLRSPFGMDLDNGVRCIWLADSDNNRLIRHSIAGVTDGQNATNTLGQFGGFENFNTGGPNGIDGRGLNQPSGVAVDPVRLRLYIGDGGNHRVVIHNLNVNQEVPDLQADVVLGQTSTTGWLPNRGGGTVSASGFSEEVKALALDTANDRLFVGEGNRVLVFDVTVVTTGESAVNVLGQLDFTSTTYVLDDMHVGDIGGLAYDAATDRLFVSDGMSHRVLVFDVAAIIDGESAANVLGQADFVSAVAGLNNDRMDSPAGLSFDSAGNRLFVADAGNHRVLVFDTAAITNGEAAVNVLGQATFNGNIAIATATGMDAPVGLAYANGTLTVGDTGNHRVMVYQAAVIVNGQAAVNVLGQSNFTTGSYNATLSKSMANITSLFIHPFTGSLYGTDIFHNRVAAFGDDFDAIGSAIGGLPGGGGGGGGGGCFIATAALAEGGSYRVIDHTGSYGINVQRLSELDTLRRFRDQHLQSCIAGKMFVSLYYQVGPYMANAIRPNPGLRWAVRTAMIRPLVTASRITLWEPLHVVDLWGFALLMLYASIGFLLSRRLYRRMRTKRVPVSAAAQARTT